MDEDLFAFHQIGHLENICPDGEEGFRQGCRARGLIAPRPWQGLRRRQGAELRITAAIGKAADLVSDGETLGPLAQGHDFAGDLKPEDRAGTRRRRIVALPLQHVRSIDAGSLDPDQDIAGLDLRQRTARQHHLFRPAGRRKIDIGHFARQGHGLLLAFFMAI